MRKEPSHTGWPWQRQLEAMYYWPNSVFGEEGGLALAFLLAHVRVSLQYEDMCSQCRSRTFWNCIICLKMSTGESYKLAENRDV